MYVNSANKGLHDPGFKSLVSAKNIWFPAVTHSVLQILSLNNLANSKQNLKNEVK
jgi:hypothetical protein